MNTSKTTTSKTTKPDWGFVWEANDILVPTQQPRTKRPIPPPPSRTTAAFSARLDRHPAPGAGVPVQAYDPLAYEGGEDCFRVNRYGL